MHREWRLNPPPNWPMSPGARIELDWRPDPAWGPPPTGWQLWRRPPLRLPIAVVALGLAFGTLLGAATAAPRPGPAGITALAPPVAPCGSPPGPGGPSAGRGPAPDHHPRIGLSAERVPSAPRCAAPERERAGER